MKKLVFTLILIGLIIKCLPSFAGEIDSDFDYKEPLAVAINKGDLPSIKKILRKDPKIVKKNFPYNVPSDRGVSPVMLTLYACLLPHNKNPNDKWLSCMNYLLDHGASPNAPEGYVYYRQPLSLAFRVHNKVAFLTSLLKHGAKKNIKGNQDMTPLHWIAEHPDQASLVPLLTGSGVNVDAENTLGWTPLTEAVLYNNALGVKALLKAGANPKYIDKNGKTVRDHIKPFKLSDEEKEARLALLPFAPTTPQETTANPAPKINDNEILLSGNVLAATATGKADFPTQLKFLAEEFMLPSGKSKEIVPAKEKTVLLSPQTIIHRQGQTQAIEAGALVIGKDEGRIQVIGTNSGQGQAIQAREIVLVPRK